MMDTASNGTVGKSPLQMIVEQDDASTFNSQFHKTVNARTGPVHDDIQFIANVSYVMPDKKSVNSTHLSNSSRPFTGSEHAVHVSKWVLVNKRFPGYASEGMHAALVEVLLWRD